MNSTEKMDNQQKQGQGNFKIKLSNLTYHSMAWANLNKSKKVLTLSDPNLLSKSTSKCKHCETRFTS